MASSEKETSQDSGTPWTQPLPMTPSSRKEDHPRLPNLDANSSTTTGFGNPPLSFGARLANVPTSISTHLPDPVKFQTHENILDASRQGPAGYHSQRMQIPPVIRVEEAPRPVPRGELDKEPRVFPDYRPSQVTRLPSVSKMLSDVSNPQRLNVPTPSQPSSRPVDPYAHRADEIGLRHSHPGAGAVDDFLTPPNWHPGQDPIDEAMAQELYDKARALAEQYADDFAIMVENEPDREARLDTFHRHWHARRRMDESVFLERRKIYRAFLQFKREQAEVAERSRKQSLAGTPYQETFQRPPAGSTHLPLHSSPSVYRGVQEPHQLGNIWTSNDTPSPTLGAYHLHQRLQLTEGLHFPVSSPISPSFLDPKLVPQTYEAAVHYYNQNKMLISQYHSENERYLANWSARFNRQAPSGSPGHPYTAQVGGSEINASSSMHYGPAPVGRSQANPIPMAYDSATQGQVGWPPRPMSGPQPGSMPDIPPRQTLPGQSHANRLLGYAQTTHEKPRSGGSHKRGRSHLREVQNAESPPKTSSRRHKRHEVTNYDSEDGSTNISEPAPTRLTVPDSSRAEPPKEYRFVGPEVKAGREKKRNENEKSAEVLMQEEIAAAGLPTPTISDDALRAAGVQPKPKPVIQPSAPETSPSKPKGRSRKAPFPAEGIRLSGSFGNALLAAGAREKDARRQAPTSTAAALPIHRRGPAPNPYAARPTSSSNSRPTTIDLTKGPSTATSSQTRHTDKSSIPTAASRGIQSRRPKKERTPERETSPNSISSGGDADTSADDSDNSNDGDYGKHTTTSARNASSPRKAVVTPRKSPTTTTAASLVPAKRASSITPTTRSAEKRSRQGP